MVGNKPDFSGARVPLVEQPTMQSIGRLVDRIAHRFHPHKIVLFGSYAWGTPTPDSDVDLLVIMETSLRPADQAAAIRQVVDCPFPMDLLVRTPEQIETRLRMGDQFIRDILTYGRVLYAADHR